jgi:hypothetical protein
MEWPPTSCDGQLTMSRSSKLKVIVTHCIFALCGYFVGTNFSNDKLSVSLDTEKQLSSTLGQSWISSVDHNETRTNAHGFEDSTSPSTCVSEIPSAVSDFLGDSNPVKQLITESLLRHNPTAARLNTTQVLFADFPISALIDAADIEIAAASRESHPSPLFVIVGDRTANAWYKTLKFVSIYNILGSVYGWRWIEEPVQSASDLSKHSIRLFGREPDVALVNCDFDQWNKIKPIVDSKTKGLLGGTRM